jgi:peptidoglycan/xylan/chitin deacetylase (PgdA/CDA1 family)
MSSILLSFDLEEFDIPEEYGQVVPENEKLKVTTKGLETVLNLLEKLDLKATFYTTAFFAEANKELVKEISEKHEVASHGFYHSAFKTEDILNSKLSLEKITGKPVKGFRMARLGPLDESLLIKSGYIYNSSLNPTFLPGRYNNLTKPRRPFISNGIVNLPVSVSPFFRIPLFWLSLKNFPFALYLKLALRTLHHDSYLNLYFHPWEFTNISTYKLPSYIKKMSGEAMTNRLKKLLIVLKEQGEFITSGEYCNLLTSNKS